MAIFSKFRVWDKVPKENTLILGDNRIPWDSERILLGQFEAKPLCQKHISSFRRFHYFCVLVMVNTATLTEDKYYSGGIYRHICVAAFIATL